MVALIYGDTHAAGAATAPAEAARVIAAAPRKAWYVRLFEAMMEARMQQANREIRLYTRLTPYTTGDKSQHVVKTDANTPVGGW